ncbi:LysR family transcriptional regulator [Velocimicrobium porci]|uniref:LysR family transcriptional regulator n=1 Tax=Velocimicrobium porci TaxID=2606634 RepID=A0A6L5Y2U3_9FIRM|nr:LysR family transcriptional regulator [Velocimicrobium porci]MSS64443.1 LysR family transcriptional regulator [Velocimicrobium porci]
MDINFELYKVFYYVAKTLSFSEASKELFISQSAVSQSIKTLEKRLNQPLFIRSTKKVQLTKEGLLLFKHIEPAVNLIAKGENQILEAHTLKGGQLRIGASDTICRYFLVPFLNAFHQSYPNVHIKVTNGTSMQCVDLLEHNQVDLIVTNSPNPKLNNIRNVKHICSFSDVFVASPSAFSDLMEQEISFAQLAGYPILMLEQHATTSEFLHQLFQQNQIDLVPAVELSSNDLLIDLAKIGLGIAFVPNYCIQEEDSDLFIIHLEKELPKRELIAAYSDQFPLSDAAEKFLNSLLLTE